MLLIRTSCMTVTTLHLAALNGAIHSEKQTLPIGIIRLPDKAVIPLTDDVCCDCVAALALDGDFD
jgi:hypothetical protein